MSNLPSSEFRTMTDTELRERAQVCRSHPSHVGMRQEKNRIMRELAVRKSLRLTGKSVLVKAKI